MRRSLGITGICFLILLFLTGQAFPSAHRAKSFGNSKKASRAHRSSKRRLKPASLAFGSSRPNITSVTGKIRLKTGRGLKKSGAGEPIIVEEGSGGTDDNDEYMRYRVKRGDTLEKLAQRFDIEKEEIAELNGAARRRLAPGSVVFIPKAQKEPEEEPAPLDDRPLKPWKNEEEQGILVKVAKSFSGAPYRLGGESVRGLDCSAFVKKMYEIFGVQLPRCAREQFFAGQRVDKEELVTGDLVFFRTKRYAKYPTHVGIYIGEGNFIHASSLFGRGVKIDRLSDSYFSRTFTGAVRVKAPLEQENSEARQ